MTIVIIMVLLLIFFLGLVVPQKKLYLSRGQYDRWRTDYPITSLVIEKLGLNEIYTSPLTVASLGIFFVNLMVVLAHRIPIVLRRSYLIGGATAAAGIENIREDPTSLKIFVDNVSHADKTSVSDSVAVFLRGHFWSVIGRPAGGSFLAVKNRYSPFGFLFFHLSFLLCLIGGLLLHYTRFSGNLVLTEGQEFHADMSQFRIIKNDPKIFKALPDFGLSLIRVAPRYEGKVGTDLDVIIRMKYLQENLDAVMKVNEPINKGAISILAEDIGVSPLFVLRKKSGEEIQGGYFSLKILRGDEDSFKFPGLPYRISVRFYPDYYEHDGATDTRSLEIRNPVLRMRVELGDKVLYDAFRRPGEWASFGDYELSCRDIRYWVDFLIVREYGNVPLYLGFFFGAAGLIIRLVFTQKLVRVHVAETCGGYKLFIKGNSEYYPQTFAGELDGIVSALKAHLLAEGGTVKGGATG
ncbi:MAG: cytochrome c biogenesis protein ResB [Nitrospiraceae bacterium]|nr:cytochrome c biogenesis protein ResB [Nitrospiraceae bacterium]